MRVRDEDGPSGGGLLGFRPHLRAEVVPGEAAYLFSERGALAVAGARLEELVPLLDGTRDVDGLVRALRAAGGAGGEDPGPGGADDSVRREVEELVGRLTRAGLLRRVTPDAAPCPRAEAAEVYWGLAGLDGAAAHARTTAATARVTAVGGVDTAEAESALAASGVRLVGERDAADLTVVLCDDYLRPELAEIDAAQRAERRPWLPARPVGAELWAGPVLRRGGPCWHCLAHRLRGHRQAEDRVQRALGRSGPVPRPAGAVPALDGVGARLAALEAVKWLAGHPSPAHEAVWVLDTLSLQGRPHPLRARPQCPECGDPTLVARRVARPVVPAPRPKASVEGGDHRAAPPEQVLADYGHLVSPVTGVVKAIERDRRGPAGLNVFRSGPNVSLGHGSLGELSAGLRGENGGKGVTETHARVSALCEALERHSGHFQGDEPRVRGSYRELADRAVHPDACQLYHERQFLDRRRWNAGHSAMHHVVEPFDEGAAIDWTPLWSLTERRQRLLPTSLLYYRAPASSGRRFAFADSNGSASGASLEDALVHGFLELVERDAAALWWYNRTPLPGVDLRSFDDPWVARTAALHDGLGRAVWALDLTSDLGIPTTAAFSRRTGGGPQDIVFGFGTHFDPAVALRRALTEVNQMLPFVVDAKPDGTGYATRSAELVRWWTAATVEEHPYLLPDPRAPLRARGHHRYEPRADLADDIAAIESLVRSHGMELLVLDQTRPDIGLPVVKVVVPGLRHFRARFAPGRLYDVPVRLGRLRAPLSYEELNPVPMFV
ncbi:TOMM precursor leader peptide-binding protein [Streptomyces capparidis]